MRIQNSTEMASLNNKLQKLEHVIVFFTSRRSYCSPSGWNLTAWHHRTTMRIVCRYSCNARQVITVLAYQQNGYYKCFNILNNS